MARLGRHRLLVYLIILPCILLSCGGQTGDKWVQVTFHLVVPRTLAPLDQPYIASSINGWSPDSPVWKMNQTTPNEFVLKIELPETEQISYYYTLGHRLCLESRSGDDKRPHRTVTATEGLVRNDTVSHWSMESVNTGRWLLEDMFMLQQEWLAEKIEFSSGGPVSVDNPIRKLKGVPQLDSLLKSLQTEWRAVSESRYQGALPEIHSAHYVPILSLINDTSFARAAQEYILEYYRLPSFFREYSEMSRQPASQSAFGLGLSIVTLQTVVDSYWLESSDTQSAQELPALGQRSRMRMNQWKDISHIFVEAPGLIDAALASLKADDERSRPMLLSAKLLLENWKHSWPVQQALVDQRPDEAFAAFKRLAAYGKNGIGFDAYQKVGFVVFHEFVGRRRPPEALEVADSLFANVSQRFPLVDLTNNYRQVYLMADSVRGPDRYIQALGRIVKRGTFRFVSRNEEKPLLQGTFLNLATGDSLDLSSLRGKIVVLDVWANYCGTCVKDIPEMKKIAEEFNSTQDVAFISVLESSFDAVTMASQYVAMHDIHFPVLLEPPDFTFAQRFNIRLLPSKFVLNRKGEIDLKAGEADNWRKVKERVRALRAGN